MFCWEPLESPHLFSSTYSTSTSFITCPELCMLWCQLQWIHQLKHGTSNDSASECVCVCVKVHQTAITFVNILLKKNDIVYPYKYAELSTMKRHAHLNSETCVNISV